MGNQSFTFPFNVAEAWSNPWLPLAMLLIVSVAGLMWSWRRHSVAVREKGALQRTLDSLPDAVALYNPKGQLTAINRKLVKMLPLDKAATSMSETTSSDLYAQLSPDNLAVEKARNRAREELENPDSTIAFELPSFGRESLLVKEKPTEDGGVAVTVHGAQRHGVAHLNDPLTALPNRAHLLGTLAKRCSRSRDQLIACLPMR